MEAEIGQLKYKWALFLCTGMMKLTVLCVDGKIEPRVTNSELLLLAECYWSAFHKIRYLQKFEALTWTWTFSFTIQPSCEVFHGPYSRQPCFWKYCPPVARVWRDQQILLDDLHQEPSDHRIREMGSMMGQMDITNHTIGIHDSLEAVCDCNDSRVAT